MANKFPEKNLLYDSELDSDTNYFLLASFVISLIDLYFFHIFHSFSKTALLISLKKSFSKSFFTFFLTSVFMSMYGFNQAFWLNLMTLCTFFKTNLWFNTCCKFLMWITYFFYHTSWLKDFWLSQFFFSQAKRINHWEDHTTFHHIKHQL